MTTHPIDVVVSRRGPVPANAVAYARARIAAALRHAPAPVLWIRASLIEASDPAVTRPAIGHVNLDLNGRFVRVEVAAETWREAIDLLHNRLVRRLDTIEPEWQQRRPRVAHRS